MNKQQLKLIPLPQYLLSLGIYVRRVGRAWRAEPCPVCGHRDHFSIAQNKTGEWYFHSFSGCVKGGDIFTFVMEVERAASSFSGALHHLSQWREGNARI